MRDILRFRRALSFFGDTYPFGQEYGPASTRDESIESSHTLYGRLLRRAPQKSVLPFETLAALALDKDGKEDVAKLNFLRKRFRPDAANNLSLFAFVQSCDTIYKKLRFFKASFDNASVISNVLERIINALFFFLLLLVLLALVKVNPSTVLLPATSVLVSLSFALGASISKYVEGIFLIAVRRPYDLGDRIFFSAAEGLLPEPSVTSKSWFVEDISLTTTTLRYSRTNEVSTVPNWAIASSRIVNCNKSQLAAIFIEQNMHVSILDDGNLTAFRAKLDQYVSDRPRHWHSVSSCRHVDFDAASEKVRMVISVRHRNSWQDASRIKTHRADLARFVHDISKAMNIHYDEPPPQQVLYYGGALREGGLTNGYKRDLLGASNIDTSRTLLSPSQHLSTKG